jgi:hypothetical protein
MSEQETYYIQARRNAISEWRPPFDKVASEKEALENLAFYRRMFPDDEHRLVKLVEVKA